MSRTPKLAKKKMTNLKGNEHVQGKSLRYVGVALVSLVYLAGLWYYAQVRRVEADEGYYTSAARLVWEGRVLYRDFSYQQSALLPYLYSWVWAVHPRSLVAMRMLSAVFGGAAVFLWGIWLFSLKRLPTKAAVATFAVILLNPYWVSWNVTVKTFAVANLLMSIVMISLHGALQSGLRKWFFVGGLTLGACASVRALYAPLVPFVLLWLLYREWKSSQWRLPKTDAFLGGATCGVLPMILSFAADPQAFVFNNLKYRNLLNPHVGLRHVVDGYFMSLSSLVRHAYFDLLVVLAIVGGFSLWRLFRKREAPYSTRDYDYFKLALVMLVVYTITSAIPYPVYDQYFTSPLLPFLAVFVAEGLRVILQLGKSGAVVLAILIPFLFYPGIKGEIEEYSSPPAMRLSSYRKVAEVIEANSSASDVVLSIWPGYVFESGRQYFPGSENHFNYLVGYKISPEARRRYHVLSKQEVAYAISTRAATIFVSTWGGYHLLSTMTPAEFVAFRAALHANYALVGSVDRVGIYRRR
jgi:hypothetical protein